MCGSGMVMELLDKISGHTTDPKALGIWPKRALMDRPFDIDAGGICRYHVPTRHESRDSMRVGRTREALQTLIHMARLDGKGSHQRLVGDLDLFLLEIIWILDFYLYLFLSAHLYVYRVFDEAIPTAVGRLSLPRMLRERFGCLGA